MQKKIILQSSHQLCAREFEILHGAFVMALAEKYTLTHHRGSMLSWSGMQSLQWPCFRSIPNHFSFLLF